jgi:hypothetical protein
MPVCNDENVKGNKIHFTSKIKIFLSQTLRNYNKYIISWLLGSKKKHWLSLELGKHDVAVFYSRPTQLEVIIIPRRYCYIT